MCGIVGRNTAATQFWCHPTLLGVLCQVALIATALAEDGYKINIGMADHSKINYSVMLFIVCNHSIIIVKIIILWKPNKAKTTIESGNTEVDNFNN